MYNYIVLSSVKTIIYLLLTMVKKYHPANSDFELQTAETAETA